MSKRWSAAITAKTATTFRPLGITSSFPYAAPIEATFGIRSKNLYSQSRPPCSPWISLLTVTADFQVLTRRQPARVDSSVANPPPPKEQPQRQRFLGPFNGNPQRSCPRSVLLESGLRLMPANGEAFGKWSKSQSERTPANSERGAG